MTDENRALSTDNRSSHDPRPMTRDPGWRVVVFTNVPDGLAYKLVDEVIAPLGHRIVGVVTTPGPPKRRSSSYLDVVAAVPPGIDVIVSNHPNRLAAMVAPMQPDLIISGGFPYLIRPDVIALPRIGAINIHPALLPRHRGPYPFHWVLRNGDAETGFTVHHLAGDFDNGAILAQAAIPISDDDTFMTLLTKMEGLVPDLLRRALERLTRGDAGDPQDEGQVSYAGTFEPEWRTINWQSPARTIHNLVRSCVGMPGLADGGVARIGDEEVVITRTRLLAGGTPGDGRRKPGDLIQREADRLLVQCGDGPLEVIAWAGAGG